MQRNWAVGVQRNNTTAHALQIAGELGDRSVFVLVVTQGEMHLYDGASAWTEFLEEEITPWLDENGISPVIIPPANIMALPAREFDWLMGWIDGAPDRLPGLLQRIATSRSEAGLSKFYLHMYLLDEVEALVTAPYLDEVFQDLVGSMRARLVAISTAR